MRQSKFTETQIVSILKEADAGRPVNEIWRKYGISSATYYKWKAKYGGLEAASDIKRLKELEQENSKLKRLYADMALENAALKDLIEKNSEARRTSGGRDPLGHGEWASGSTGLSGGRVRASDVLSANDELGTPGCAADRGADRPGSHESSLGILEIRGPIAAHRASLEP